MSEINFDGLVGPTHNYAGLAFGNVASTSNAQTISNPKIAAKQGLDKMRLVMELGIPQAVLPPQQRPNLHLLRQLGFFGSAESMLQQAYNINPNLLAAIYSASSMWAANAATISPSCNTADNKVHITPANLAFNLHRAQESEFNYKLFKMIFTDDSFVVHETLPSNMDLCDEGAANHSVLCTDYNQEGIELFIYGRMGLDYAKATQRKYIPRQTQLASIANVLQHKLNTDNVCLIAQSPEAIDAGAFHNDVVFVANKNVMLYHMQAFQNWGLSKEKIREFFDGNCHFIEITSDMFSLEQAVATYLFNSQLLSIGTGMILIAPKECNESVEATRVINMILVENNPINRIEYVDCRQSMQNGGGPACLRLRAQLTESEQAKLKQSIFLTPDLYNTLSLWIDKYYRDKLAPQDLLDPNLIVEVQSALDELTNILDLGSIYNFQA